MEARERSGVRQLVQRERGWRVANVSVIVQLTGVSVSVKCRGGGSSGSRPQERLRLQSPLQDQDILTLRTAGVQLQLVQQSFYCIRILYQPVYQYLLRDFRAGFRTLYEAHPTRKIWKNVRVVLGDWFNVFRTSTAIIKSCKIVSNDSETKKVSLKLGVCNGRNTPV